jgi:methylmalonyl-CoA/ethylmalonyl-CoA epimerase
MDNGAQIDLPAWLGEASMVHQVGIVVRDLHPTLTFYTKVLGIGPWKVFRLGADQVAGTFKGVPGRWDARLAFSPPASYPQLELVMPVAGDNVHTRYLAEHGDGVQHFGMRPADFDATSRALTAHGYECVQTADGYGQTHDGRNAYFDTRGILHGLMLEIIKVPTQRWDPVEIWPVDGDPIITEEASRPWPR